MVCIVLCLKAGQSGRVCHTLRGIQWDMVTMSGSSVYMCYPFLSSFGMITVVGAI